MTDRAPRNRTAAGALLALALAAPLVPLPAAGQAVELRWKYRTGDEHVYRQVQESGTSLPGQGAALQWQTVTLRQKVLDVSESGVADLLVTHERVEISSTSPAGTQEYDSDAGEPPDDPAMRMMARLPGMSFRMRVAADGTIESVSGFDRILDDMVDALAEEDPAMSGMARQMLGSTFSDEGMRDLLQHGMQTFPREPVSPGETWTRRAALPLFFGTFHFRNDFELLRVEDGVAHVTVNSALESVEPAEGNAMAGMLDVEGGDMEGTLEFDLERGLLQRSVVSGTVTVRAGGMEMQTRTTTRMELVEGT